MVRLLVEPRRLFSSFAAAHEFGEPMKVCCKLRAGKLCATPLSCGFAVLLERLGRH